MSCTESAEDPIIILLRHPTTHPLTSEYAGSNIRTGRNVAQKEREMKLQPFGLVVCVTAFAALAQAQQYKAPLASDGHPDLQGFWANNNATPLERPKELANHPALTDAELQTMRQTA